MTILAIVNSLNLMIETQRIESPLTQSQRLEWLNRMGTSGEFADHIFLQLTANNKTDNKKLV